MRSQLCVYPQPDSMGGRRSMINITDLTLPCTLEMAEPSVYGRQTGPTQAAPLPPQDPFLQLNNPATNHQALWMLQGPGQDSESQPLLR